MAISTIFAYIRLRSGSLWGPAVMHSSHNVFVQSIFTPLTIQTAITPFIIDEFGVGIALVGLLLAVFFIYKGKSLALETTTKAANQ
jgi:membrane protease YdiL (CAAX protease family)